MIIPRSLRRRVNIRPQSLKRSINRVLYGPAEKLLFEHIPKCGGTSVKEYLKSHYTPSKIFEIDGMNVEHSLDEFRSMSDSERCSFDLLLGHGAHKLRHLFHAEIKRLTILRDPVERIVSHYFFARQSPRHYLHAAIATSKMTLAEYATSDLSPELKNNYVRRFTGVSAEVAELSPDEAIDGVMQLLESDYAIVGTLESLDKSIRRVSEACNFNTSFKSGKRLNVTNTRPSDVDPETLELISQVNSLDVEIYRRVRAAELELQSN